MQASCQETTSPTRPVLQGLLLFLAFMLCLCAPASGQNQKKTKLDKTFKDWLDRDVVYIITKDERDEFLKLPTDEARDKFIEQFWEIRNPDPGSPSNSYKDEIYKRMRALALAPASKAGAPIAGAPTSRSANRNRSRSSATRATCTRSRSGSTPT